MNPFEEYDRILKWQLAWVRRRLDWLRPLRIAGFVASFLPLITSGVLWAIDPAPRLWHFMAIVAALTPWAIAMLAREHLHWQIDIGHDCIRNGLAFRAQALTLWLSLPRQEAEPGNGDRPLPGGDDPGNVLQ